MRFFLHCIPPKANHQSKKIVRVGGFSKLADSDALQAAKATLDALLVPHRPDQAMSGPLSLTLAFYWPWPSGTPQKAKYNGPAYKVTSPDCDNLAKTITDRLAALRFIENDAHVVRLVVSKYHSAEPGIDVTISAAGEA